MMRHLVYAGIIALTCGSGADAEAGLFDRICGKSRQCRPCRQYCVPSGTIYSQPQYQFGAPVPQSYCGPCAAPSFSYSGGSHGIGDPQKTSQEKMVDELGGIRTEMKELRGDIQDLPANIAEELNKRQGASPPTK